MMRFLLIFILFIGSPLMFSQSFDAFFENKTLRLDYIFEGNDAEQRATLDGMVQLPAWEGRRVHLNQNLLQGNGQIQVYDFVSDRHIYTESFSTLFQEWQTLEEAKNSNKSFENVFLIPFPKQKIKIKILFFDKENKAHTLLEHIVDPKDITIRKMDNSKNIKTEIIHSSTYLHPIKIAIVAEGYTENEMRFFINKSKKFVKELFRHAAFKKYENRFEIIAVKAVSKDSGITTPRKGEWKNTAIGSQFDTFNMDRYLTIPEVKKMHDLLAGIPYHHMVVLANSEVYGGGGIYNSYAIMSTKFKKFAAVTVHEFGHSFAGLADEYFYPSDNLQQSVKKAVEPWEQNITTLVHFEEKWQIKITKDTPIPTTFTLQKKPIGAYEGLIGNGIYIPGQVCRMKSNDSKDFCVVCNDAIEQLILFYTEE